MKLFRRGKKIASNSLIIRTAKLERETIVNNEHAKVDSLTTVSNSLDLVSLERKKNATGKITYMSN